MKRFIVCAVAVALLLTSARARADFTILAVTQPGSLEQIDTTNGNISVLGSNSGAGYEGLGYGPGSVLYAVNSSNQLVTVNTTTGANTLVGNLLVGNTQLSIATFAGLGNGQLYAFGNNGDLYSINATTGAATDLGSTGLTASNSVFGLYNATLSGDGTNLYLTLDVGNTENLYTLNLTTGQATLVGPLGTNPIIGSAYVDGQLYGIRSDGTLWDINTQTGAATSTGVSGLQAVVGGVGPLNAPTTAAPEPSSLTLLALGTLGASGYAWRRKRSVKTAA